MIETTVNIGLVKEDENEFYNVKTVNENLDKIDEEFDKKVNKAEGKELSSNDYTNKEKEKLKNIDENANYYTHPTDAGNKHIPPGGSAGQVLKYSGSSGSASWGPGSFYGTCSTAAETAEKKVALTGFSLFNGATVAVMFSNGNTAAKPTLNVNNTGAKAIYYRNAALTESTASIIAKNGVYLFVYSGSYWRLVGDVGSIAFSEVADTLSIPRMIDGVAFDGSEDITHFGVCETEASIEEKKVTIPGFKLVEGASVRIKFIHGNSAVSAALNVNNTGKKTIYRMDSSKDLVSAGDGIRYGIYEFTYSGEHWIVMSNTLSDRFYFESNDVLDEDAKSWTSLDKLTSGLGGLRYIISNVSTMFKNTRFLNNVYNGIKALLGSKDISEIGDGTVTGILKNLEYKDFSKEVTKLNTNTPTPVCYVENGTVYILGSFIAKTTAMTGNLFQVPEKYAPRVDVVGAVSYPSSSVDAGKVMSVNISTSGIVSYYTKDQLNYAQRFTIQYPLKTT